MTYVRTAAHRAAIAASNALHKRKFPVGFDCRSRLYRIWRAMLFRCYQPSHKAHAGYSKRGITVCNAWRRDYAAFMRWALSSGYAADLTLDRRNNCRGYSPGNCRWITRAAQNANRSDSLPPITAFGKTKSLKEWAADPRCCVTYRCLWTRIRTGRMPEWALSTPINHERRRKPHSEATRRKLSESARRRGITSRDAAGRIAPRTFGKRRSSQS